MGGFECSSGIVRLSHSTPSELRLVPEIVLHHRGARCPSHIPPKFRLCARLPMLDASWTSDRVTRMAL